MSSDTLYREHRSFFILPETWRKMEILLTLINGVAKSRHNFIKRMSYLEGVHGHFWATRDHA